MILCTILLRLSFKWRSDKVLKEGESVSDVTFHFKAANMYVECKCVAYYIVILYYVDTLLFVCTIKLFTIIKSVYCYDKLSITI